MTTKDSIRAALEAEYLEGRKREAEHSWSHWSTEDMEAIADFAGAETADPDSRRQAESFRYELERRQDSRRG